jgi:DNA-binding transcriptional MerR regulator
VREYTSNEVIARTGITPRQLQWWDERGVVQPERQGRRRVYSRQALAEVAVICELRRRGISLQKVRKVMRLLQREFGQRLAESGRGAECHLLTDGRSVYIQTSAQQVLDVLRSSRQPMLAICLSDTVRRVTGKLSRRRRAGKVVRRKPPQSAGRKGGRVRKAS